MAWARCARSWNHPPMTHCAGCYRAWPSVDRGHGRGCRTDRLLVRPADGRGFLDQLLTRQAELKALLRKYARHRRRDRMARRGTGWLAEIEDPAGSIEELKAACRRRSRGGKGGEANSPRSGSRRPIRWAEGVPRTRRPGDGEAAVAVAVTGDRASADDRLAVDCGGGAARRPEWNRSRRVLAGGAPRRAAAADRQVGVGWRAVAGDAGARVVLAEPTSGSIMVFDEVDAGVGGAAAVEIGRRLSRLARAHQVIVVTHLPQVAHSRTITWSSANRFVL